MHHSTFRQFLNLGSHGALQIRLKALLHCCVHVDGVLQQAGQWQLRTCSYQQVPLDTGIVKDEVVLRAGLTAKQRERTARRYAG